MQKATQNEWLFAFSEYNQACFSPVVPIQVCPLEKPNCRNKNAVSSTYFLMIQICTYLIEVSIINTTNVSLSSTQDC